MVAFDMCIIMIIIVIIIIEITADRCLVYPAVEPSFNFWFLMLLPRLGRVTHSPLPALPNGMDFSWRCACCLCNAFYKLLRTNLYCCGWAKSASECVS